MKNFLENILHFVAWQKEEFTSNTDLYRQLFKADSKTELNTF